MAGGPLIAAAAQTTTTTTGTGPLTISNSVPSGAPAGSTTFAAVFAPAGTYPVPNIFYVIQDASGNYEAGYGTLTSATNLTRDFVIFSGVANTTAPYIPQFIESPTASFLNLASGTANVYSNPALLSAFTPQQARFPNFTGNNSSGTDGGITEDIMRGSFTATVNSGSTATTGTIYYKVSSAGQVTLSIPTAITGTASGTTLTITGVPAYLSNLLTGAVVQGLVTGTTAGGVIVPGLWSFAGGASPTATGTITLSQYTSLTTGYSATFTTAVVTGIPAQQVSYGLN